MAVMTAMWRVRVVLSQPKTFIWWKSVHTTSKCLAYGKKKKQTVEEKQDKSVLVKHAEFMNVEDKSKMTFGDILKTFELTNPNRRGHVEFIYAALKVMKDFGVDKELIYYKKLMDLFPKDKMVPRNRIQVAFMHFPLQQECAVRILEQMETNGVFPDEEIQMMIMKSFGHLSMPMRKYARINYWMPKFRHASPWPLPRPVPNDTLQVALLGIKQMTSVDLQTVIEIFQTSDVPDAVDKTWIVSGQSPDQKRLLLEHPKDKPLYIDGAFRVWLRNASIAYFVLRSESPDKLPKRISQEDMSDVSKLGNPYGGMDETAIAAPISIHHQEDATYFAMCATGTSSRDSLLSWLRILSLTNPCLEQIPVIFTLKAPSLSVVPLNFTAEDEQQETTRN